MPQYMLIAYSNIENYDPNVEFTPEMIQAVIQKYDNWANRLKSEGHLVDLAKLQDQGGRVVRGTGDDQHVTDGPFAEAKEVVGGYWVVNASSYDEAVSLLRDCPHLEFGGMIEVREIDPMAG